MIARILMLIVPPAFVLLVVLGILHQLDEARTAARHATEQRDQIARQADTLASELAAERSAQAKLRTTQDSLRAELARRHSQIEDLKHENQELREWAAQPLPAAARRLRERPALTGADAYQDWLSGRGAVPPAGDRAGE